MALDIRTATTNEIVKYFKELTLEDRIERHLRSTESDAASYQALCARLDESYVPSSKLGTGAWDVHPENKVMGQAHVSIPVVWFTVNLKSNMLGMRPPKFNVRPLDRRDQKLREDAEFIETVIDKVFVEENMDE